MLPVLFVAATALDALLLHLLPPVATGVAIVPALIVATFGNLFLVGAVAPFLARRLHRRLAPAPSAVRDGSGPAAGPSLAQVRDRTASALLAAGALGLLATGLATRPLVVTETEATEENAQLARDYVERHGSAEVRRNLDTANSHRLADGRFRTCVSLDNRFRAFCMFVDTVRDQVVLDPDRRPNGQVFEGQEP